MPKNIFYINGYRANGESSKHIKLTQLLNMEVKLAKYIYKENNIEEIRETVKDADLIIASSTGAYLARDICYGYNIPLISLNPVIDLQETFSKIGVKAPNIKNGNSKNLLELIICTKDDELIDYKKTLELFKDKRVTLIKNGGHRMIYLEPIKDDILDFIKSI